MTPNIRLVSGYTAFLVCVALACSGVPSKKQLPPNDGVSASGVSGREPRERAVDEGELEGRLVYRPPFPAINPLDLGCECSESGCEASQWLRTDSLLQRSWIPAPRSEEWSEPPGPVPTMMEGACSENVAEGVLIGVGRELKLLRGSKTAPEVAWVSRSGVFLRAEPLDTQPVAAVADGPGDQVAVAFENGIVQVVPGGSTIRARGSNSSFTIPPKAPWPLGEMRTMGRLWTSGVWMSWLTRVGQDMPIWEWARFDEGTAHFKGQGAVIRCGHPLFQGHKMKWNPDGGGAEVEPLEGGAGEGWAVLGDPLDEPHCAALGDHGILVLTGRIWGFQALVIHDDDEHPAQPHDYDKHTDGWQLVLLQPSESLLEPRVVGRTVLVSAPGESVRDRHGNEVQAAGAVYVIEKLDGRWTVKTRVVSAKPETCGLFGFSVGLDGGELYVNQVRRRPLAPPDTRRTTSFEPVVCRFQLETRTGANPSDGPM